MGLVSIDIICSELVKHGLPKDTACALIQQGTTSTQKEYISDLENMPCVVKNEKPSAPTIFIIGGVVKLRDRLKWYSTSVED